MIGCDVYCDLDILAGAVVPRDDAISVLATRSLVLSWRIVPAVSTNPTPDTTITPVIRSL